MSTRPHLEVDTAGNLLEWPIKTQDTFLVTGMAEGTSVFDRSINAPKGIIKNDFGDI